MHHAYSSDFSKHVRTYVTCHRQTTIDRTENRHIKRIIISVLLKYFGHGNQWLSSVHVSFSFPNIAVLFKVIVPTVVEHFF